MKEIIIDCRDFISRSDLHRIFAAALSFPDHYGNNLDALHDCLSEIGDTTLRMNHWNTAEQLLGRYACCTRRAIEDAAADNVHLTVIFD